MSRIEDEFEAIATRAIEDAGRVDASVAEYQEGLRSMMELCAVALAASQEMDEAGE